MCTRLPVAFPTFEINFRHTNDIKKKKKRLNTLVFLGLVVWRCNVPREEGKNTRGQKNHRRWPERNLWRLDWVHAGFLGCHSGDISVVLYIYMYKYIRVYVVWAKGESGGSLGNLRFSYTVCIHTRARARVNTSAPLGKVRCKKANNKE